MIGLIALALFQDENPNLTVLDDVPGQPIYSAVGFKIPDIVPWSSRLVLAELLEESGVALPAGDRAASGFRAVVSGDRIALIFKTPPDSASRNATALASLFGDRQFDTDSIEAAFQRTSKPSLPYWAEARIGGHGTPDEAPSVKEMLICWPVIDQADNVSIAVKGDFGSIDFAKELVKQSIQFPAVPKAVFRYPEQQPKRVIHLPEGIEAVQWRGSPIRPWEPNFPIQLLATVAIGQGTQSVLSKVSRFEKGWSYDQESVLMPEPHGFSTVSTIFRRTENDAKATPEDIAKACNDGIDKIDETQLIHYKRIAGRALRGSTDLNPILISSTNAYVKGTESQVLWTAIWGKRSPLPNTLVRQMEKISLTDLKAECHRQLDGTPKVLAGDAP